MSDFYTGECRRTTLSTVQKWEKDVGVWISYPETLRNVLKKAAFERNRFYNDLQCYKLAVANCFAYRLYVYR